MKATLRSTLAAALLLAALFACSKTDTAEGELNSLTDIIVNGPGVDGSVHEIRKVMYTLKDIHDKQNYTLRTEIGLLPGGQAPDGTLTVNIYLSGAAYAHNPAAPVESAVPLRAPNSNIYEVNFSAPSSGDYVVVISGLSSSIPGIQFFYNLRLMSADTKADPPVVTAVLTPITSETITTYEAVQTNPLNPGYLNIYNGGDVTSSGTYTINLISNATTTIANPQIFVYLDSSLTISNLMLSSIPTTTEFVITTFNAGVPDNDHPLHSNTDVITHVTFTTGAGGGPFIVLKGFIGAVTYTLSVRP